MTMHPVTLMSIQIDTALGKDPTTATREAMAAEERVYAQCREADAELTRYFDAVRRRDLITLWLLIGSLVLVVVSVPLALAAWLL